MVASLLELRLRGVANRVLRPRSRAEQVTSVLMGLAVIAVVSGIVLLTGFGAETTSELRRTTFVAVGAVVVLAFWLVPFVVRTTGGVEPRAFTAYPIPPRRLAVALAATAVVSGPALLLVLLLIANVVAWAAAGPGPALAAAGSGMLLLATAVLGSLVAAALASDGIVWRNITGVVAVTIIAVLAPLLLLLDWSVLGLTYLRRIAAALEWTPFGVAWSVPAEVALGEPGLAWLRVGVAVGVLAVLWFAWEGLVRYGATRRARAVDMRAELRLGAFEVLPDTQSGVVAARSVTYWLRDPRYLVPLLMLPIIPAGIVLAFWLAGIPWEFMVWLPIPLVSLLIGWSVHNDVAADGTAFWLHVVASVRGRADRWGRILVPGVIGLVVAVGGGIASAALVDDDRLALPIVGLSICALLVGLGVGSAASALAPYPTVRPGDGPFQQPQGSSRGAGGKQIASLLIAVALCLPVVAAIVTAVAAGSGDFTVAVATAFGLGVVVLVAGVELGALAMRRRAPELLAFTQQN
ncbi:MAG TPA: hypothetical protein VNQ48_00860 [Microbacteriaceae bacterium]|nr:hypothetical protein [Microbacteriaceae bacterium]